jgi:hypothetical protein
MEKSLLRYLKRGWSIIPVGRDKKPFVPWKQFQERAPSEAEIQEWAKKFHECNWALVTGRISGVVVLDIDPRNGGSDSLVRLEEKYGKLTVTAEVITGGGGRHIYFKHPGFPVKNCVVLPGLEIKGDGGSVTLPPSVHESGKSYVWKVRPDSGSIATMPDWLVPLTQNKEKSSLPSAEKMLLCEGSRNSELAKLAGYYRRQGLDTEQLLTVVSAINRATCNPPLPDSEVRSIVLSIGKYPSGYDSDAYITPAASETKWIAADKLAAETPCSIDWIWEPFIAKGSVTLLSSAPKAGKTTLLNHFLKHIVESKPFLGHDVTPIRKVLLLTEEHSALLWRRFEGLGLLKSSILVILRHKLNDDWKEALGQIVAAIKIEQVDLVIIDTLAEFWDVKDENDSQSVMRALKPLKKIVHENNIALVVIHHLRKAPGEKGSGHRGSSAITGTADINLELREEQREQFRTLSSRSRFWETPKALIIELKDGVYHCHGSPILFKKDEVEKQILKILSVNPSVWLTRGEILDRLVPRPSETAVKTILATSPFFQHKGDGKRGCARRYQSKLNRTSFPSLGASKSIKTNRKPKVQP